MVTAKKERPEGFRNARIEAGGICHGPECCGQKMADDGDCGQGCCDDYKCEKCGYTTRVEWPD